MTVRYILYAGHRDCEVQVHFAEPLKNEVFSTGVLNIKGSSSFSDHKGLVACWGTDWPVNDTVKYAKETVGVATCLPSDLIKETFGYKTKEDWFAFVQKWKKELHQSCQVEVK